MHKGRLEAFSDAMLAFVRAYIACGFYATVVVIWLTRTSGSRRRSLHGEKLTDHDDAVMM